MIAILFTSSYARSSLWLQTQFLKNTETNWPFQVTSKGIGILQDTPPPPPPPHPPKPPNPQPPKTPKPQNPKTPKPQNPKTPKPQNPKILIP